MFRSAISAARRLLSYSPPPSNHGAIRLFSYGHSRASLLNAHIYRHAKQGVVKLINKRSAGTAFVVDEDGTALTCAHNFRRLPDENRKDPHCEFLFADGSTCPVVALDFEESLDLAICRPVGSHKTFQKMIIEEDADEIKVGDEVYAIGFPEGHSWSMTKGTISSVDTGLMHCHSRSGFFDNSNLINCDSGIDFFETKIVTFNAKVSHGSSGGPLLNNRGRVIGMVQAGCCYKEAIIRPDTNLADVVTIPIEFNIACPMSVVLAVMKKKGWMGKT